MSVIIRTSATKAGFHVAGKPFAPSAAKGKALAWNDGLKNNCVEFAP